MSLRALVQTAAAAGLLLTAVSAECQASNGAKGGEKEDNSKLCLGQGEGQWTFSMHTSLACVPTLDGDNAMEGCADGTSFYIFDDACAVRGTYGVPDCGAPFAIKENFLSQVLTVTSIFTDVGQPYFSFKYGDGEYSVRNNHCGCEDDSSGLQAAQACKCAFPVDGTFEG